MYVNIGARRRKEGLVALLLECHERIRSFLALARVVGERADASNEERREACAQCRRYFAEALPLHVADEEESILPRLRGREGSLDAALARMHEQHGEHEPLLASFVQQLDLVHDDPADDGARAHLLEVAARLLAELDVHLAEEERAIFPALASLLSREEQEAIIAELRMRRAPAAQSPSTT